MRRLILTLACCLLAAPVWAVADLDGTCTVNEPASCTNCDVTHTVTAGNLLVGFIGVEDPTNVATSATWDFGGTAQAMTEQASWAAGGDGRGSAFTLVSPTTGTKTLRFVLSGAEVPFVVICSVTGANTGTPLGTIVEQEVNGGATTGSSLAYTLGAGGLALSFINMTIPPTSFAQGADQTAITTDPDTYNAGSAQGSAARATVSPLDYTWSNGFIDFWHVVIPINAASARRPIPPILLQ